MGRGFFELKEPSDRELSGRQIMDIAKDKVNDMPGIIVEIAELEGGPDFSSPLQIGIFADNESDVIEATDKIEKFLNEGIDGMANVRSTFNLSTYRLES